MTALAAFLIGMAWGLIIGAVLHAPRKGDRP